MQKIKQQHHHIQTILVTGARGFIGKVVVQALLDHKYHVVAMMRPGSIPPFQPNQNLSVLYADVTQYDSFSKHVAHVDCIIHLAANKYHPKLSYEVNIAGAKNIIRLIEEKKIRGNRIINISSQSTKIKKMGVYGSSKCVSDDIIQSSQAAWTTIKPSLVYGKEKGTLFQTIKGYVEKLPVVPLIGDGKWELYPVSVDDFALALIAIIEKPKTIGRVYDYGCKEKVSFDELIHLIQDELRIHKPILHIPPLIGLIGVWAVTKIFPKIPISVDNVLGSTQNTSCKPKTAIQELGVEPISVVEGIKKYVGNQNTRSVSVAVVGLGKMGILHSTILSSMPQVKIVALIDRERSLGTTAQSMGIHAPFYQDLTAAILKEKIDAVYICTPTFAHAEVIEICNKNHIPFFVEKPIFSNYEDFQKNRGSLKKQSKNASGYFWIHRREIEYTKQLLQSESIGKIKKYSVSLKHSEVFGPKKGWLFKKALSGGGVLANPGPHAFSIIQFFFGDGSVTSSKIEHLYKNEVEDKASVTIQHETGVEGVLEANWSIPNYPVLTIEYSIVGTKGSISFTQNSLTIVRGKKKDVLPMYQIPRKQPVFNLNPKSGGDAYYIESKQFIESLLEKTHIIHSFLFGYKVETLIHEAYDHAQ